MENKVVIDIDLNKKSFEKQIEEVEYELEQIDFELSKKKKLNLDDRTIKEYEKKAEKLRNTLVDLYKKQRDIDKQGFANISKGITNVIKKVGKWSLAIFGVRSAYSMIRGSMSLLSQYNDDLADKIENIKYALASSLERVINGLVNTVYKLMQYVDYLARAWFNVNIFSKKAAKNSQNASKSLSAAGFDEVNKVSGGTGGGSSSIGLEPLPEAEVPEWLKWIKDNKEGVLQFFTLLGGAFVFIKGLEFASTLKGIADNLKPILNFITNPTFIGIVMIISGIYIFVKGILDYLADPTWDNFMTILGGIVLIAGGIFLIFGGIPALIALIVGAIVALGVAIYKNWETIKGWFSNIGKWVNDKIIQPIKDKFNSLPGWMKTLIRGIINNAITCINILINGINGMLFPLRTAIMLLGKIMGKNWSLDTIKIPTIPKLANGGILNNPGSGVFTGNAIVGERGREGYIPMDNAGQMSLLGQEIARYVNINNVINNNMDGRRINRIQAKSLSRDAIMSNGV